MSKRKKVIIVLLSGLLLIIPLLSSLFILRNAGHNCIHENCSVCMQIEGSMRRLQKMLLVLFVGTFVAYGGKWYICNHTNTNPTYHPCQTLITLKVLLLN